ncbi:MAG: phenylalanine--tRNA ligase subunit alpha, partial [Actinobacteria bacterium]|nr:phenylalanine--tRNA ligase subunit alpha [Actinomycetota bacterium]
MEDFLSTLHTIEESASRAIESASTLDELESVRVEYLGRKSDLNRLLRSIGDLPQEDRRTAGSEANRVKS